MNAPAQSTARPATARPATARPATARPAAARARAGLSRGKLLAGLMVAAGLLLLGLANAHLVHVAVTTAPGCVPHLKPGQSAAAQGAPAQGGFSAASSAC